MSKNLELVSPKTMSPQDVYVWVQTQAGRAAELCEEASTYWRRMKEHNESMEQLAEMMKELAKQPKSPEREEEISDVMLTIREVVEAMRYLRDQSLGFSETAMNIEQLEAQVSSDDEGKTAAQAVKLEIDGFLTKYNLIKSRLGLKTQQDVADRTGFDRRQISRIESGDFKPQFKTIQKLAEGFGVAINELL